MLFSDGGQTKAETDRYNSCKMPYNLSGAMTILDSFSGICHCQRQVSRLDGANCDPLWQWLSP